MTAIIVGILLITCAVSLTLYYSVVQKNKKLEKDLAYYDSTYLWKQGWTSFVGGEKGTSYKLLSLDGGKNWYAIDEQKKFINNEVIILGVADSVYPGLLKNLDGFDKLEKYVQKNGPIGSKPISKEDVKALEDAGFTVKQK